MVEHHDDHHDAAQQVDAVETARELVVVRVAADAVRGATVSDITVDAAVVMSFDRK